MPTGGAASGRLIFTNKANSIVGVSDYIPGSGVGSLNTSVRRALKRRAAIRYDPIAKKSYNPCCQYSNTFFPVNK